MRVLLLLLGLTLAPSVAAAQQQQPDDVVVHAGADGFSLGTRDHAYSFRISLGAQLVARQYLHDAASQLNDAFYVRRLRPRFEGTLFRVLDYLFMPELGGEGKFAVYDLWVSLHIADWLQLRVGKQKVPFGLERLQSYSNALMAERGLPTRIAPNRDLGVTLFGSVADGAVQGWLGVFNGNPDGSVNDEGTDDAKDVVARLFFHPFRPLGVPALRDLGLGGAFTWGIERGTPGATDATAAAAPSYQDSSRVTVFQYRGATTGVPAVRADGERLRFGLDGYWYVDRLTLFGEWNWSRQTFLAPAAGTFTPVEAWSAQAQAGVLLTDDAARYDGVRPSKPFDPWQRGEWGALELTGRYQELHVSTSAFHDVADPSKSARITRAVEGGVNWHLTTQLKLQVNYAHVFFEGGAAAGGNRLDEDVLLFLLQVRT